VLAASLLALSALAGCSKKQDTVVEAADRVTVTAADIDGDPLALLPGGAIGITRVDAPALFASEFGQRLEQLVNARVPLPPSAGFVPRRDLSALYIGLYSMQGADSVTVATGTFQPDAIERAMDGTTMTPLGAPLVKTAYSGRTLYVSRNVGFVVLTPRTVLVGNETGIRRALDRLSEGRAHHDLPKWMDSVLGTDNAAIASVFDFVGQAPAEALVRSAPFLRGLKTARVLGNFQPPGMNFAGSLTYPDPSTAGAAAAQIEQTNRTLQSYSFFMQLAGIGNPIQSLKTQPVGSDAEFVVAVQGRAVEWALNELANEVGASGQPVPASTGPIYLQSGGAAK
jgi:hypothetical protein